MAFDEGYLHPSLLGDDNAAVPWTLTLMAPISALSSTLARAREGRRKEVKLPLWRKQQQDEDETQKSLSQVTTQEAWKRSVLLHSVAAR
ncbi:hypothetical protein SAY87_000012 [Trapa incisa]|uniref:Uncharacterized protein n=1 Tax=Trapa incisa TaxID=236973 RepID=A0AAN7J9J6_9MYRT|nr:hypothetical protein SAY87_000012 [Trapa incisa]